MNRLHQRHLIASTLILTMMVGAACQSPNPELSQRETAPAGWPETLNEFTVVWTADPGIDLLHGPTVPVRAYMESFYLSALTEDTKYLYPGFAQSVAANSSDGPDGTENLWPTPNRPRTWVGTLRHHILRVDQSGRDTQAVGCAYMYGTAAVEDGDYQANVGGVGPNAGIRAFRIELQAPEDPQPLPPQQGTARTPSTNVFGGWRIGNFQGGYFGLAEWANASKDQVECEARAEHPPEDRDFRPGNSYPRSDFPTLPPSPGWPAEAPAH